MRRSAIPSSSTRRTRSRPAHVVDPMAMPSSLRRPCALIPRQLTQLQADPPSLGVNKPPHVNSDLFVQPIQEITLASVDATSLSHAQPEQQSDSPQSQQAAALNILSVGKQLDDCQMDPGATSPIVYPSHDFSSVLPRQAYLGRGIGESTTDYTNTDMESNPGLDYADWIHDPS
jgi:hypothetical protein